MSRCGQSATEVRSRENPAGRCSTERYRTDISRHDHAERRCGRRRASTYSSGSPAELQMHFGAAWPGDARDDASEDEIYLIAGHHDRSLGDPRGVPGLVEVGPGIAGLILLLDVAGNVHLDHRLVRFHLSPRPPAKRIRRASSEQRQQGTGGLDRRRRQQDVVVRPRRCWSSQRPFAEPPSAVDGSAPLGMRFWPGRWSAAGRPFQRDERGRRCWPCSLRPGSPLPPLAGRAGARGYGG